MEIEVKGSNKYKDRLFRFIFGREDHKDFTLSLYNAVNHSNYTDPSLIQINTLDDVLFIKMKNDVSFVFDSQLYLYEQQSTDNPNMAYRMLEYVVSLFQRIVEANTLNKYGYVQISLPAPHFIVFYNGLKDLEEYSIQKLSDLYENGNKGDLELTVQVYNINEGKNTSIKNSCRPLYEYMWLVNEIRSKTNHIKDKKAFGMVIQNVLHNMPEEFLIKSLLMAEEREVVGMFLDEWNEQEHQKAAKKYAELRYDEGMKEGEYEAKKEVINSMYALGIDFETIAASVKWSVNDVKNYLKEEYGIE